MGQLYSTFNGQTIYLREYHTLGRRPELVDNIIEHNLVSKVHAFIEWDGEGWYLRDVSTNGTFLNDVIVAKSKRLPLKLGDVICFCNEKEISFEMVDSSPPKNLLISIADNSAEALEQHHFFPNDIDPVYGLYFCNDRLAWFSEKLSNESTVISNQKLGPHDVIEQGPFKHGDFIDIEGQTFQFFLVNPPQKTELLNADLPSIDDIRFRYDLSIDEETTRLTLSLNDKTIDLGERTHHYLMVYLLREKHRQSQELAEGKGDEYSIKPYLGWVDVDLMSRDLGFDELHINTLIFRARKQFSEALNGIDGIGRLIERRRGVVKLNAENTAVYKAQTRIL